MAEKRNKAARAVKKNPRQSQRAETEPHYLKGKPSPNRGKKFPVEVLTEDEVRALIGACSNRAPTGIRNRALIVVLWRAQLRVSEVLSLTPKDLDADVGTVRVLHGKGDKARLVGMDADAFTVIERWMDKRRELGINGRGTRPLFCTLKGDRMQWAYVDAMLKRKAAKAGIEKRIHAHGLRHSGAAEMRAEGMDIGIISKQLGHSSIATTARYLDHIAPHMVIEVMRKRSGWLSNGERSENP